MVNFHFSFHWSSILYACSNRLETTVKEMLTTLGTGRFPITLLCSMRSLEVTTKYERNDRNFNIRSGKSLGKTNVLLAK